MFIQKNNKAMSKR